MLKIVHLNTYDGNGGAGRACLRLDQALLDQGVNSRVIVYYKFKKDSAVKTFTDTLFKKAKATISIVAERILARRLLKPVKVPFSFTWFGSSVIHHPDVLNADVIHLHWINHSFLNPKHLAELRRLDKPIVWTFHDSNAFTGGCHVRFDCRHFENKCGNCPVLKDSNPKDYSNRIWNQKNEAYKHMNFHVVAPSRWMQTSVKSSSLLRDAPSSVIPNTLETIVFCPKDAVEAKSKLGIAPDKLVLLTGFMPSRKDSHKGTAYLTESLNLLVQRPGIYPDQIELLIFGNRPDAETPDFPFKTRMLGTIQDDEQLALTYAAADAFLIPSLDDNLPYTVLESLACGTPVIAFTTGGIPDMVKHLENGYLAQYRSAESFADGIDWLIQHRDKNTLRINARETVIAHFSEKTIAQQHIDLYQSLLANHHE